jgi:cbb3-type cytochrome oxidase subunit 3
VKPEALFRWGLAAFVIVFWAVIVHCKANKCRTSGMWA